MDDPKKLQREAMVGLEGLAQLVQREEGRRSSQPTPSVPEGQDEVSALKKQMEELHERFINLCARIESREHSHPQTPSREVALGIRPSRNAEIAPRTPLDFPEDPILRNPRSFRFRAGIVGLVLMVGALAIWSRFGPLYGGMGELAIESQPAGADVYLENQFRGQTPLELKSVRSGNYQIKLTKEGYRPLIREVRLSQGETARVAAQLNDLSAAELQELARSLFNQGKLREADRICTLLFKQPPYDAYALELKEKILNGLLAQIGPPGIQAKPATTETLVRDALQPGGSAVEQSNNPLGMQNRLFKIDSPNPHAIKPTGGQSASTPHSKQAAAAPFAKTSTGPIPMPQGATGTRDQRQAESVDAEMLNRIKSRIQSKDFAEARALLQQLPESHPAVELKNLIEAGETAAQKQRTLVSSALQKAESALIVGHYVNPPDDNVVLHCNRGLGLDPQNQRLLALKKDVIQRSIAQARDWIQRGRFEQARVSYSSLNYLAQNDTGFPIQKQWFREELNKLEFTSYPVIHDHKFGSCTGRLRMNAHVLSFVPSGDSSHGFTEPIRNITVAEAGEKLKVRLDGKSYEFHPNSNQDSPGFQAVYEQLMNLVAKAN